MSCLRVQFGRAYVVCRRAEDVILLIRPTLVARLIWTSCDDVLWTSWLDARRTCVRRHLTTSHARPPHVFIGLRRMTSTY